MLGEHEAWQLGFTPQIIGVFFNGLTVLDSLRPSAEGTLAARVGTLLSRWVTTRGKDVVKEIHAVEELLRGAGRDPLAAPDSPGSYQIWAADVRDKTFDAAKEAFDAEDDLAAKTLLFRVRLAHDLGEQIGDVAHLYILASLVQLLREDAPEHEVLRAHAASLALAQASALERLARVAGYAAGEADITGQSERVLALLRDGPRVDTAGADELSAVITALEIERLEELFRPRPSSPG